MFNIKILWKMVHKSFKKLAELIREFILVPIIVLKLSSLCTFPFIIFNFMRSLVLISHLHGPNFII